MRLLILYEELAPYFYNNIQYFADTFKIPVRIVTKHINPVAPFQFQKKSAFVEVWNRDLLSFDHLFQKIQTFSPTCLMQSGWIYKPYFEITKRLSLSKTILLLDNPWENKWRQHIGCLYFKWRYKHLYQKAFVPGNKQKEFAKHLGFDEKDIETGLYCCDTPVFEKLYQIRQASRKRHYKFLYVGRYAPEKNIEILWRAFAKACAEYPNHWQLLCVGKGNITPVVHPQIHHLGFLQPERLLPVILQSDVFVLPSTFEPWGVVLHEMTTAGLPVITSNKVGANELFVQPQKNGYIFLANNEEELKTYLIEMMRLSDDAYFMMADISFELSKKVNTTHWIQKIYHFCKV